ncbi:glutaredoxin family protein [Aestuariimicrobium sp. p3-SID1156]|uniref:glutaredoxin family protein n=1 Tax=Aestuariimicrobium sp. p3-SID1156 TaxID=2916038 RepID=UPI00223AA5C0|nr:glutaredoxin family protein [Aestuariimicrobium sp. p3-SID1156]MCT1458665.1 glutaredoxin family protein [Aestuariimicrobium sp. p3-SID1156]
MRGRPLKRWLGIGRRADAASTRPPAAQVPAPGPSGGGLDPAAPEEFLGPLDAGARVIVLTREGCHLCSEALNTVQAHCAPGTWAGLNVDDHPTLRERYTDHVPVVFVDGRLLAYWSLDEGQLASALAGADWSSPPSL